MTKSYQLRFKEDIASGRLKAGALVVFTHRGQHFPGKLLKDGRISMLGFAEPFSSPNELICAIANLNTERASSHYYSNITVGGRALGTPVKRPRRIERKQNIGEETLEGSDEVVSVDKPVKGEGRGPLDEAGEDQTDVLEYLTVGGQRVQDSYLEPSELPELLKSLWMSHSKAEKRVNDEEVYQEASAFLTVLLASIGLVVVPISGAGGRCQFEAIAHQLNQGIGASQYDAITVRNGVLRYMREDAQLAFEYAPTGGWNDHAEAIERGQWGDYFTLTVAATVFRVNIRIVSSLGSEYTIRPAASTDQEITIGHIHEVHYVGTKVASDVEESEEHDSTLPRNQTPSQSPEWSRSRKRTTEESQTCQLEGKGKEPEQGEDQRKFLELSALFKALAISGQKDVLELIKNKLQNL